MDRIFGETLQFAPFLPMPILAILAASSAVLVSVAYWREARTRTPALRAAFLGLLRMGAVSVILLMLLQPSTRRETVTQSPARLAVLIDASESMNRIEPVSNQSRFRTAQDLVESWMTTSAGERFRVRYYLFAADARPVAAETLAQMTEAEGPATDIGGALRQTADRERGEPLSGIVLLTDGAHNTGADPRDVARELGAARIPIHAVGIGGEAAYRDIDVMEALVPEMVFEDESFNLSYRAYVYGYDGYAVPFSVRLLEGPGYSAGSSAEPPRVLAETSMDIRADVQEVRGGIPLRFREPGHYRVELSVPAQPEEYLADNNRTEVSFEVRKERMNVLLLEGRPRREYAFLMRYLAADLRIRVLPILQTRPGRYNFAHAEEWAAFFASKRPGMGIEDLVVAPEGGGPNLPRLAPPWEGFDCVILGDVAASLFAPDSLDSLVRAVRDSGVHLVLAGGIDSFGDPALGEALSAVLPCRLGGMAPLEQRAFMRPVPTAWDHPALQLGAAPGLSRDHWNRTPPLVGYGRLSGLRPGASVLLARYPEAAGGNPEDPLWVLGTTGKGKVLVSAVDDTWRWVTELPDAGVGRELFSNLWRRSIRWLITGEVDEAGRGLRLVLDKGDFAIGEEVTLGVSLTGFADMDLSRLSFSLDVRGPQGQAVPVESRQPLGGGEGWQATWSLRPSKRGDYAVRALLSLDGKEAARANANFTVEASAYELTQAALNEPLLQEIAASSGGRYYPQTQSAGVLSDLRAAPVEMTKTRTVPLWNTRFMVTALFAFLAAEWTLRRLRDMA